MDAVDVKVEGSHRLQQLPVDSYEDNMIQQQMAILRQIEEDNMARKQPAVPQPRNVENLQEHLALQPPQAATPGLTTRAPISDDVDFTTYLSDPELILEQRRILEHIQREAQAKLPRVDASPTPPPSSSTTSSSDPPRLAAMADDDEATSYKQQVRMMLLGGSPTTHPTTIPPTRVQSLDSMVAASEDSLTLLPNGKKVRLKGTQHTYMAMEAGTAVLVRCFLCQCVLHVPSSTITAVYCPICQEVMPLELAAPDGATATLPSSDVEIACAVQQQEVDVACARKAAKMMMSNKAS